MTKPQADGDQTGAMDEQALDENKQAMRRALDAKRAAQHRNADGVAAQKSMGGPNAQVGGRRQFRRKAGG